MFHVQCKQHQVRWFAHRRGALKHCHVQFWMRVRCGGGGSSRKWHVSICIALHGVSSSCCAWLSWQTSCQQVKWCGFESPWVPPAVRQNFHPHSAVEARRKTSSVIQFYVYNVRKTDGYRLMSRRTSDRNWLGVFNHFANFAEAGRLDADVKRIISSLSSWT